MVLNLLTTAESFSHLLSLRGPPGFKIEFSNIVYNIEAHYDNRHYKLIVLNFNSVVSFTFHSIRKISLRF